MSISEALILEAKAVFACGNAAVSLIENLRQIRLNRCDFDAVDFRESGDNSPMNAFCRLTVFEYCANRQIEKWQVAPEVNIFNAFDGVQGKANLVACLGTAQAYDSESEFESCTLHGLVSLGK